MMINESDNWSRGEADISSPDALAKVRAILEKAPIILEHRHYRRASAPTRMIFDEYDDFLDYLKSNAFPGDSFYAWDYTALCRSDNEIVSGKFPDAEGRTPRGGAY